MDTDSRQLQCGQWSHKNDNNSGELHVANSLRLQQSHAHVVESLTIRGAVFQRGPHALRV